MAKKQKQDRKQELAKRSAVESLSVQVHFGLKRIGYGEGDAIHSQVGKEIESIEELGLTQDILQLKDLVGVVQEVLGAKPVPGKGDFHSSVVAVALGIASVSMLEDTSTPYNWQDQIDKKVLTMYYPDDHRNAVVECARAKGYTVSTYLGRPIVKFKRIYVRIERARE